MSEPRERVCVIGLDGGTFDVLDQWIAIGAMPNLAGLMARGSRTELISTVPPMTGPAWTSMTTGVNPGAHGIFDFLVWSAAEPGARSAQSGDVPVPRFWDLIGETGRTVGVYNVPVTYPASEVNGFMVTGMLTPRAGPAMTHPPSLSDDLTERDLVVLRLRRRYQQTVDDALELVERQGRTEAALRYLLERFDPDFFIGVLQENDRIQHRFWPYCDRSTGGPDQAVTAQVDRFFRRLDETIGWLVNHFGQGTRFFVVSDHGFGPSRKACLLNTFLARHGFLSVDWRLLRRSHRRRRLRRIAGPLLARLRGRSRGSADGGGAESRPAYSAMPFPPGVVDWSRTRAFAISRTEQAIRINVRGREPHGVVEPGAEYEAAVRDVIEALQTLKDPDSGEPLVTQVVRREEVHSGPYADRAPDLYVVLGDRTVKPVPVLGEQVLTPSPVSGDHRMNGILVASGPGIKAGADALAQIADVTPTVLYSMGVPVPRYMDGKALLPLFDEEYVTDHPVQYSDAPAAGRREGPAAVRTTEEDEAAVRERLRRLGYL